ncbi:hypothetical protein PHMEG_00028705 [Phytophthora megakarya]|uniref:M96 mating-specific protein n=1 Tax=Phytophthora megakarya TaxID=4795 RepID=A0A225V701_9STRA|nr:hypothetical protein PHMEG_00028705 [Phytophthora megakarya]
MKQEREALRYEESQLSKRLAVLMHNFKEKNDRRTSDTNCISTWKTIALCLQAERQHAEDERYQLQVAVESQSFFIQQFYALVVKQLGDRNLVCDLAAQQCEIEQRKDGLIFTAQVAELDVNYACTDNIFSATDRVFMGERISVNQDGTAKCLQSRIKHKYPFNFYHSRDSIWELFRTYNHQKDREPYSGVANPDSTYAFKFRVSTQLTTLVVRIAIRRYLTDNQMVMVWRTFTEGEGSFSGMHCSESGWTRVRPCETGTTIEMYVKLIPVGFSSTTTRFYDAVSLFRQVAQDHEAHILYALGTFPIDKMSTI